MIERHGFYRESNYAPNHWKYHNHLIHFPVMSVKRKEKFFDSPEAVRNDGRSPPITGPINMPVIVRATVMVDGRPVFAEAKVDLQPE